MVPAVVVRTVAAKLKEFEAHSWELYPAVAPVSWCA